MSFWENASGATKGVIVIGTVLILAFGGMYFTNTGIYSPPVDEASGSRGFGGN
jgi:hypothetical protein